MSLFNKLQQLQTDDKADFGGIEITAPLSGEIVNIEDVPDPVLAAKEVGDGIAIKPTGNRIVAPVNGTVSKIFPTNNAFTIESEGGVVEILIGFGDEVEAEALGGKGFKRVAQEGQNIRVGDTIIEFDLAFLEANLTSTLTSVVICNMDDIKELNKFSGNVIAGETPILRVIR